MNKLNILYEDNHIIVVVKPCNILSQKDETNDLDMLTLIKNYLKEKYNKPGNVYLGLVHRLDRPVSGVMVFAKTSKAASRLSEQIRMHSFKKNYLAVANGIFKEKSGELIDNIIKNSDNSSSISNYGKEAKLKYTVLEENNNNSLIEIELETGRHHQIRIQMANQNHPLYGDQRYGIANNKQIALHAYKISFIHPTKKEKVTFTFFPKSEGIWNEFKYINEKQKK